MNAQYIQTVCAGCGGLLDMWTHAWRDLPDGTRIAICWQCANRRTGTSDRRRTPGHDRRRATDGGTDG